MENMVFETLEQAALRIATLGTEQEQNEFVAYICMAMRFCSSQFGVNDESVADYHYYERVYHSYLKAFSEAQKNEK